MEFKDYYAVLGVEPSADEKTIKTAFRKLARLYHPDVSKEANSEKKFKDVAEAYEVLHSRDKRAEYDELRQARSRSQRSRSADPGFSPGFSSDTSAEDTSADQDFADFFNSIFGPARSRNPGFQSSHREDINVHKGRDLEMEWPVMLEDTLSDVARPIEFTIPYQDIQGKSHELKKTLNVKIPAGIGDGERIRLKGQGAPGIGNAASGDLYLNIRLVPHPLFDIEAHNLIIILPLAPWEAALGAKITLPTLTGKINLSIPANSQSGQRLRIKGKGLVGKHGIGDLFAVLKIVIPPTASDDVRKLWTQLAEKSRFDPRTDWSSQP